MHCTHDLEGGNCVSKRVYDASKAVAGGTLIKEGKQHTIRQEIIAHIHFVLKHFIQRNQSQRGT